MATLPVPVLAAVNGDAYGGGAEVAVACDIRIAADDVRCAFNQVALGIMPAWGGIERLTALVGRGRALALMTTGRVLDAAAALDQGLFDEVVPRAHFDERWREVAAQIARAPRDALVGIKAAQRAAFPTARPELARGRNRVVRPDLGRRDALADGGGSRAAPTCCSRAELTSGDHARRPELGDPRRSGYPIPSKVSPVCSPSSGAGPMVSRPREGSGPRTCS